MSYSEAEAYVIRATREGHWAKFSKRETISAELIRRLMLGLPLAPGEAAIPTPCGVRIINAVVTGRLILNNARGAEGSVMPGLVLDECEIAEGIDLSYAQLGKLSLEKTALKEVRAVRAIIEGEVIANDIRPISDDGYCFLSFYSARISGDIQMRRAVLRESPDLDLFGAEQFALDLRNALIDGNVYLRNVDCIGTVNLGLAVITGNFTARSATFAPREGRIATILGDGCEIKGAVSLRQPAGEPSFQSLGQISFIRARFGALVLDGAIITPGEPDGFALNLESATIEGGVYMRDRFRLGGVLNIKRTTLKADLTAAGATFAMGVDGVGLMVAGEVDLSQVTASGSLIDLSDARIGTVLKIGGIKAHLDLSRAHVETFDDCGDCWLPERLLMDGFVYKRLEHPNSNRTDKSKPIWEMRLKWLSRQSNSYRYKASWPYQFAHKLSGSPPLYASQQDSYRPQPLLHMGRVLSDMGFDNDARQIIRAKQWIEARHEKFVVGSVLRLFGLCFGFGYSSRRAFAMLVLYFALGWWGVTWARETGWLVYDIQPTAVFSSTQGAAGPAHPVLPVSAGPVIDQLPCKDVYAYSYALDLMIPLIDLHVEGKCEIRNSYKSDETFAAMPAAAAEWKTAFSRFSISPPDLLEGTLNREWPAKVAWNIAHTAYALLGWLVVSLAILTFSGLLRQKEHLP